MKRRDILKYTAYATGFAVTGSLASALLSGCKAEPPSTTAYQPAFFTEAEYATIAEMSETMLPPTQTPGAKELGVPEFIDLLLKDFTDSEDQERWRSGIRQFMANVEQEYGKAFNDLSAEEKLAYLNQVDAAAKTAGETVDQELLTVEEKNDRFPFFLLFKSAAIAGYFSSEKIGTEVLAYDPVPGQYAGCIPLEENGGVSWSL